MAGNHAPKAHQGAGDVDGPGPVCPGCKLRDERIQVLEQLVMLQQQELVRRRTFETHAEALVARANELQQQLDEAVKANGDSADGNGPPGEG